VTAAALLMRLADLGVSAKADHGALRLRPASAIPPDLLVVLQKHKAELLAVLTAQSNGMTKPSAPTAIDLGPLPAGPCPGCGGGLWWRSSVLSAGPSPWRCRRCERPDPAAWLDGHAVRALARTNDGHR
jgi:hypothetical protein